jgi:thiol-disulfide isomerase/thioredoxin
MRRLLKLVWFLAVCVSVSSSFAQEAAPPLVLPDLAHKSQSLEQLKGRIVVLNFWATWCVPCREEMPMLSDIAREYGQRGVVVVGVNTDDEQTRGKIPEFMRKTRVEFPVWAGATTAEMERFGLGTALPATAFIDRDGHIVGRVLGPLDETDVRRRLDYLLGDGSGPAPEPLVNNIEKALKEHEEETGHQHGAVSLEGASSVPS